MRSIILDIWHQNRKKMIEAFKIALGEYGVQEWTGPTHNPEVMKFFKDFPSITTDETSWCAAFVYWCIKEAGMTPKKSLAARDWLNWGEPVFEPELGDIVIFSRGDPKGWQGHIGFYVKNDGSNIWVLGGNQSNQVVIDKYAGTRLLGYRRYKK